MTLFKKDPPYGYIFIDSKFLSIFADCGDWFCDLKLLKHVISLGSAGILIFERTRR